MAFGGDTAESFYDEGLTASMKGDLAHAIQYFERAVQMNRSFMAARHQLGKAYARVGKGEQAVSLLRDVVARKPDNLVARLDLGTALLGLGRILEAREQFNFVIGADESNPRGYLGLAETYFAESHWQAAVRQAQEALNRGGQSFQVLFLLGRAAKLAGDTELSKETLERAEKLLDQSVEISPDNPEGYYFRGEVFFAREQFAAALDQYRAAESRAKPRQYYSAFGDYFTFMDIMAKQGLCYQRLGQTERAREIGRRILRADPENRIGKDLYGGQK